MSDPLLVGPANLATVAPEDVEDLIGDLRGADFDARLAHDNIHGAGPEVLETVVVWVVDSAGQAAIGAAVTLAIQWMRRRFRSTPHKKSAYVYSYEDDEGRLVRIIEMNSPTRSRQTGSCTSSNATRRKSLRRGSQTRGSSLAVRQ